MPRTTSVLLSDDCAVFFGKEEEMLLLENARRKASSILRSVGLLAVPAGVHLDFADPRELLAEVAGELANAN
jgi:hypothetical protein